MTTRLRYIFVADDFTGATDTLATLARTGLRVRLFLDVPDRGEVGDLDAFGIATDARALGADAITRKMRELGARLRGHAPELLHLKICSTFDSAPNAGNFARSLAAMSETLAIPRRAILGGQPSLGRYCVFGTLFARAPDGAVHRIDRHPIMRSHPVTPMTEADLCAHVETLGGPDVQRVGRDDAPDWTCGKVMLFDALTDADISRIGAHLRNALPLIAVGSSSVAEAAAGTADPKPPAPLSRDAPLLGFAGSQSAVSAAQVNAAREFVPLPALPEELADDMRANALRDAALRTLAQGKNTLLHIPPGAPSPLSSPDLATRAASLVAAIVERHRPGGLIIAGGDSSSAVLRRLAPGSIAFAGDLDPGVSLCRAEFREAPPLPIVLKGGQVGRPDLFDTIAQSVLVRA